MPVLKNQRHERFAQELAKGKPTDEAYTVAGYHPHRWNASRLRANEAIATRLAEIQERGARRAEVTIESLTLELEEARELAKEVKHPSAAVSATMGKAKINGKIIDQVAAIDITGMSDDELALAAELYKRIAARRSGVDGIAAPAGVEAPEHHGTQH